MPSFQHAHLAVLQSWAIVSPRWAIDPGLTHPGEIGRVRIPLTRLGSKVGINPQNIGGHVEPTNYRIAVRGRLTERLGSAFEEFALEPGSEKSVLIGEIRDQAHLYGILDLVRDLGLELVSVEECSK